MFVSAIRWLVPFSILPCLAISIYSRILKSSNSDKRKTVLRSLGLAIGEKRKFVGFFHPYCNAGGGGELVLWMAVALMQHKYPDVVGVVYTGDVTATKEEIIDKVKSRFNVELDPSSLHFVYLNSRHLVEDTTWPRFTLLGQSVGSMYLAWEAMSKFTPDLYIDSMGYAFTFHIVQWLAGIPIGAYVHYPTISMNMVQRVQTRQAGVTNAASISSSTILSRAKLIYYRLFMYYYSLSLKKASFLMVNSSWTQHHVDFALNYSDGFLDFIHLFFIPYTLLSVLVTTYPQAKETRVVYPPCEMKEIIMFPIEERERVILSVAQFRPEKDHASQLRSFHALLTQHPEYLSGPKAVKLVLVGGCRNDGDAARVNSLRTLAKDLGIADSVQFVVNASYPEMLKWQSRASIGLSTMVDEHFGINVVEFMAAGVIPVTHASGGPLNDIVVPFQGQPTGFHATTPSTFATAFHQVFSLSKDEEIALRSRARTWAVHRFSREEFEKEWENSGWRGWLSKRRQ